MNAQDSIRAESHKDPAQLEREIDQQRNHIEGIVKALETKLTPGDILGQVMQMGKGGGRDLAGSITSIVRENPMPALVTAAGLVWLYSSSRKPSPIVTTGVGMSPQPGMGSNLGSSSSTGLGASSGSSTTVLSSESSTTTISSDQTYGPNGSFVSQGQNYAGSGSSGHASLREKTSEKLGSAKSTVSEKASNVAGSVKTRASQASDGLSRMLEENPAAVGAIGIAVGALLGAIIPKTQKEDEWLGTHSDRLTGQIKDVARRGYEEVATATREIAGSPGNTGSPQDRSLGGVQTASGTSASSSPRAH